MAFKSRVCFDREIREKSDILPDCKLPPGLQFPLAIRRKATFELNDDGELSINGRAVLILPERRNGKRLFGRSLSKIRRLLQRHMVIGHQVMNHMIHNPHLIPRSWRFKRVFFLGSIFCPTGRTYYVCYLYWEEKKPKWSFDCIVPGNDNGDFHIAICV